MVQQQSFVTSPGKRLSRKIELAAALLGLVLSVGSIGYMIYQGLAGNSETADIVATVERVVRVGPGYLAEIVVENKGGKTGAGVTIEGVLKEGGRAVETSEATFDYIPGLSERRGGLYFSKDPASRTLTLRPLGMSEP